MIRNCFSRLSNRLSHSESGTLARNLATIITAKRPLAESLEALSKQTTAEKLSAVLSLVAADLRKGSSLASAFQTQQRSVGLFFCQVVTQGETTGNLGPLLAHMADYYEKITRFRKKIFCTLKYPTIVVSITTGALGTALAFFVPAAVRSIQTYAGTLPPVTKIALAAVTLVPDHRQLFLALIVLFILFSACLWYTNDRLQWLEKIAWNIPLLGNLYRGNSLRRISSILSFLLSNGMNPSKALEITAETVKSTRLRIQLVRAAQEETGNNESLSAAFYASGGVFPSFILDTLSHTKEHRNRGEQFKKTAELYEEEIEASVTALVLVIEPLFVAITGLLGVGILVALYLPMLHVFGSH
jgi:type II secretory pathway component PulF